MDVLIEGARALGIELDSDQARAFRVYADELLAWNAKFNLTAITNRAEIDRKHFLDSLAALPLITPLFPAPGSGPSGSARSAPIGANEGAQSTPGVDTHTDSTGAVLASPAASAPIGLRVLDVGAGAGLPAVPLKLVCPAWRVTLLEATRKKCDFLEHLAIVLPLRATRVLWGRAESAGRLPVEREQYDLVLARAVAELDVLAEYMLPFARVGGYCLAWKGDAAEEVRAAAHAIELLGGRLSAVYAVRVPGVDAARSIVLIEKVAPTPEAYPRREGVPAKRPLR